MNCNKYFYFGVGGVLASVSILVLVIITLINRRNEDDPERSYGLYYLIGIIAFLALLSISILYLGGRFGGIDVRRRPIRRNVTQGPPQDVSQNTNQDPPQDATQETSQTVAISTNTTRQTRDENLKLYYYDLTDKTTSTYNKKMKSYPNTIFVKFVEPENVGFKKSSKGADIFGIPFGKKKTNDLLYEDSNKVDVESPIEIDKKIYTSLKKAVDEYIDRLINLAKAKGITKIVIPAFIKDGNIKLQPGEWSRRQNACDISDYFVDQMNDRFEGIRKLE